MAILDRLRFGGVMLGQFLVFTFGSQVLGLSPSECVEAACYSLCMWGPDLVNDCFQDADFLLALFFAKLLGVPFPFSKLACAFAYFTSDGAESFIYAYGMCGLLQVVGFSSRVLDPWAWWMVLNHRFNIKKVPNFWGTRNHDKRLIFPGEATARGSYEHMFSTVAIRAEGCSLVALSRLLHRYGQKTQDGPPSRSVLEASRLMASKVVLENVREMWFQASLFSLTMSQMTSLAQAKFITLLVLAVVSAMPKVHEYLLITTRYYKDNAWECLKAPQPPAALELTVAQFLRNREMWQNYISGLKSHPLLALVTDLANLLVLPIGLAVCAWALLKVGMSYVCEDHVWNLTSGCITLNATSTRD